MDKYLEVKDISELLKVDPRTVRNWINRGDLPAIKVGNRFRIEREDLQQFLDDRKKNFAQD